jgi:hypothetical protein
MSKIQSLICILIFNQIKVDINSRIIKKKNIVTLTKIINLVIYKLILF